MQHRFAALVTALVVVSFASVTEARAQTTTTRCLTRSDRALPPVEIQPSPEGKALPSSEAGLPG